MAELRVTTLGGYVEQDPASAIRVTTLGAYVEQTLLPAIRATTLGAYVELRAKDMATFYREIVLGSDVFIVGVRPGGVVL